MVKLFISFMLIVLSAQVQAETLFRTNSAPVVYGSTAEAACRGAVPSGTTYTSANSGSCWGYLNSNYSSYAYNGYSQTTVADCPAGQARTSTGACQPTGPDCSSKLPIVRRFEYAKGVPAVPPSSFGGCAVKADEVLSCRATATGSYCMWQVSRTGGTATDGAQGSGATGTDTPANPADRATNTPALPSDSKGSCPAGTVQAGVDSSGIPMCIGSGTAPEGTGTASSKDARSQTTTTQKTTNAAGQPVETTTTKVTNSDGSVTTTTTAVTTAADGTKTVSGSTVTGTNTAGRQGTPDSKPDDFCVQHPDLTICRNSSVSGSCGAIACQGDAIQCATLRAAAAMQCAQEQDAAALKATPSKMLGDSILAGADPMKAQIDTALKGTEVDLSKPQLDQNGFLGGGSCLADKTFTVMGKSVSVSFARLCNDIQPLRTVIMACAFIVAYLIVSRSVLNT